MFAFVREIKLLNQKESFELQPPQESFSYIDEVVSISVHKLSQDLD